MSLTQSTEVVQFDEEGKIVGKSRWQNLFLTLLIILIASLAFGIGRLTGGGASEPIKIELDGTINRSSGQVKVPSSTNAASAVQALAAGSVVVSAKGTKYHYSHCPGAKQISEVNKIIFDSAAKAESAGYTLAANCKSR